MKSRILLMLFLGFTFSGVLKAQGLVSYNVSTGYSHFDKSFVDGFEDISYPFKPSLCMGNRIELGVNRKNFKIETGFSIQRIQYEWQRRDDRSRIFINGQALNGVAKSKANRKYYFLGIPISINLNLLKSKVKAGVHPILLIKYNYSVGNYFTDTQGNNYPQNMFFRSLNPDDHILFLETFLEYTHQVYNNTWMKVTWFKTQQFFNLGKDGFLPGFRFEIGVNQYVN